MKFIFAAPPNTFVWADFIRESEVEDVLASYYYFGGERERVEIT